MVNKASHLLVFLLGLSVAVGFYEGRRLVADTGRAMAVASGPPPTAHLARETVSERQEPARPARRAERAQKQQQTPFQAAGPAGRPAQQGKAGGLARSLHAEDLTLEEKQALAEAHRKRSERRNRRMQAWQQLSPEERAEVRERRRERLAGPGGARMKAPLGKFGPQDDDEGDLHLLVDTDLLE